MKREAGYYVVTYCVLRRSRFGLLGAASVPWSRVM